MAKAKKKDNPIDVNSVLAGASKKTTPKGKKEIQVLPEDMELIGQVKTASKDKAYTCPICGDYRAENPKCDSCKVDTRTSIVRLADEILDLMRDVKSKQAKLKEKQAVMTETVEAWRRNEQSSSHKYFSSTRIMASARALLYSLKHAYTKLLYSDETVKEIDSVLGEDRDYDDWFARKVNINVKEGMLTEKGLQELIKVVGAENFGRFFDVEQMIVPTKKFTEEKAEEFTPEELERLEEAGVKQYTAAYKGE